MATASLSNPFGVPLSQKLNERQLPVPRVLLVDDDETFGKIMARIAQREGIPLTYFSSVKEFNRLSKLNFDVAIIDYDLGTITGLQLSEIIERYLQKIPVVLVSQYRHIDPKYWPRCVRNFVHKAVGPYQIFAALFDVHEQSIKNAS